MTTIQLRAFLETHVFTSKFYIPRAIFDPRVLGEAQDYHRHQGSNQGGDESHSSVLVQGRHGQLRSAPQEIHGADWWSSRAHALGYTKKAGRHHVWRFIKNIIKYTFSRPI